MAPRETENNAYAKFWDDKQRALSYVMVFAGVVNCANRGNYAMYKHKRKCKQKKMTFFYISCVGAWVCVPFHTQPKKSWFRPSNVLQHVALSCVTAVAFAFTQGPGSTQKTETPEVHGTFSTQYFC